MCIGVLIYASADFYHHIQLAFYVFIRQFFIVIYTQFYSPFELLCFPVETIFPATKNTMFFSEFIFSDEQWSNNNRHEKQKKQKHCTMFVFFIESVGNGKESNRYDITLQLSFKFHSVDFTVMVMNKNYWSMQIDRTNGILIVLFQLIHAMIEDIEKYELWLDVCLCRCCALKKQ